MPHLSPTAALAWGFGLGLLVWASGIFNRGDSWQAGLLISLGGPLIAGWLMRWPLRSRLAMAAGALLPLTAILLYILIAQPDLS